MLRLCTPISRRARCRTVQFGPLVEQGGFRGVQVLGLPFAEDAPAESHHPAAVVLDGENDASAEAVIVAGAALPALVRFSGLGFARGNQSGLDQHLLGMAILAQGSGEVVPAVRGETDPELGGDDAVQPALLEIGDGLLGVGMLAQLLLEPGIGQADDVQQLCRVFGIRCRLVGTGLPRHFHGDVVRQFLHRFHETQVGVFHEEADGGTVGAAAEAVIELLGRTHRK